MRAAHLVIAVLAVSSRAWGYGEDVAADDHSTAHYDMALAMARCSGFTTGDATTIGEADEVVDTLAYGATAFEFAAREGQAKLQFHFPEGVGTVDGDGNGPLRMWAEGTGTLAIAACDAAGTCCDTKNQCVAKGSLAAVGAWLHAVGDYWSHHACTAAGGTDHTMFDATNADQAVYCPPTMHGHEWGHRETTGRNATLQANAIHGLQTMRDSLASYATARGLTACGAITDADLTTFASQTTGDLRVTAAHALYAACDAACPGGAADSDAGVGNPPAPAGCGCDSATPGGFAAGLVVLGILLRRRRVREPREA